MTEQQDIKQPKNQYFHIMLNMADDELDVYEYRLLGHYIRVGVTFEGTRTTAKKTKMSVGKVVSTRNQLVEKGYIAMTKTENQNDTITITIIDRMAENVSRYTQERSPHEQGVHSMNTRRSPHEQKKNNSNKNQEKDIADYAALPVVTGRIIKEKAANPYYDAIKDILGLHGGHNGDMQKMLMGISKKNGYAAYNLSPAMDVLDFIEWGKWAKKKLGQFMVKSPAKVNGYITEWREMGSPKADEPKPTKPTSSMNAARAMALLNQTPYEDSKNGSD